MPSGVQSGGASPLPALDATAAARLILETNACFALHRHYDPYPTAMDNSLAEATVVEAIVNAYTREYHHAAHTDEGNRTDAARWQSPL